MQFSISTGISDYAIPKAVTSMNKIHSQAPNTQTIGATQGKLTHSPPTASSSAGDAHQAIWTGHSQRHFYSMSRTTLFLHLLFFKYSYFFQLFSITRSFYTKNCIMFLISFHITKELPNLPTAYISKELSGFQKVRRKLSPSIDKTQEIWQFQSSEATEKNYKWKYETAQFIIKSLKLHFATTRLSSSFPQLWLYDTTINTTLAIKTILNIFH